MALPSIGTLWIGGALSWLEQLCLQSFLDNGHDVVLYTYDEVSGVPDGVRIEDAGAILPTDRIIRHARTGSPAYHADLFRLHMLKATDHIWADTDAYCVQPWRVAKGAHFHGWISDRKPQVNNGVLRLPATSRTLQAMLEFTSDEYPVPPWLPAQERARLERARERGDGVHVSLMPWGVWGPDALTWFLKQTGEIEHAREKHVIYPVPFAIAGVTLNPQRRRKARNFIRDDTLSIHFWGRRFRNVAAKYGGLAPPGSLVCDLLQKHGINQEKTAHMIRKKPVIAPLEDADLSMFDDGDVANILLQRSELGNVSEQIRSWIDGDDAPLLDYAREHREQVLGAALQVAADACETFVSAVDADRPGRIADIGCGYALADLILFRRYDADLVLIDIEETRARHFGFARTGAGYTNLNKARLFLEKNGVPADRITLINPQHDDLAAAGQVDLAISLISCGFHYPVTTYTDFFTTQLTPGGAIVLDIRKGSGGIAQMKKIARVKVLDRQRKFATILARRGE